MFQLEEYDMMVRELGFEMKAQPSEKMKTPEELAREAREKLQKLEVCSQGSVDVTFFIIFSHIAMLCAISRLTV